jgi:hypothetical protein
MGASTDPVIVHFDRWRLPSGRSVSFDVEIPAHRYDAFALLAFLESLGHAARPEMEVEMEMEAVPDDPLSQAVPDCGLSQTTVPGPETVPGPPLGTLPAAGTPGPAAPDGQLFQAAALRDSGLSVRQIAARMGISKSRIHRLLAMEKREILPSGSETR